MPGSAPSSIGCWPRTARGPHRSLPALDELILTVLSQNTSDLNCGRAYRAMRARYPRWEDVLAADRPELVEVLRPGGLANQKAPRIQAILARLAGSPARARPGVAVAA